MTLYLGNNLISGVTTTVTNSDRIGQLVSSIVPLTDAGLHLLDGSLIQGGGIYDDFVTYIAGLVSTYPDLFETEANWQTAVNTYGVCGKFVYTPTYYAWKGHFPANSSTEITVYTDTLTPPTNSPYYVYVLDGSTLTESNYVVYEQGAVVDPDYRKYIKIRYNTSDSGYMYRSTADDIAPTVRLPKITGILEGTTDVTALGDLIEQYVKLPNITGAMSFPSGATQVSGDGATLGSSSGRAANGAGGSSAGNWGGTGMASYTLDASRSSSVYSGDGTDTKIQPQALKVLYYIVIATTTKTEIEVDIDEIATDLNGKADVDLTNINTTAKTKIMNLCAPDYANKESKSVNTTYTASSDGYLVARVDGAGVGVIIYINDVMVATVPVYTSYYCVANAVVAKGDTYRFEQTGGTYMYGYFIPMKGVN